jgi:hypothetical protein
MQLALSVEDAPSRVLVIGYQDAGAEASFILCDGLIRPVSITLRRATKSGEQGGNVLRHTF